MGCFEYYLKEVIYTVERVETAKKLVYLAEEYFVDSLGRSNEFLKNYLVKFYEIAREIGRFEEIEKMLVSVMKTDQINDTCLFQLSESIKFVLSTILRDIGHDVNARILSRFLKEIDNKEIEVYLLNKLKGKMEFLTNHEQNNSVLRDLFYRKDRNIEESVSNTGHSNRNLIEQYQYNSDSPDIQEKLSYLHTADCILQTNATSLEYHENSLGVITGIVILSNRPTFALIHEIV